MARQVIGVQHEPVYRNGRMIGYYTHTDWVDRPDQPTTKQAPPPTPKPQTPPTPTPPVAARAAPPRVVTLSGKQFGTLLVRASTHGVLPLPDVHGEVLRREAARAQQALR